MKSHLILKRQVLYIMKVLKATTNEQGEKMNELIQYIYQQIFPKHFHDSEIEHFKTLGVLETTKRCQEYTGIMRNSFQVITSLQTIIIILESLEKGHYHYQYEEMFTKNVSTLQQFDLCFPFSLHAFRDMRPGTDISIYTKAVNEYLV